MKKLILILLIIPLIFSCNNLTKEKIKEDFSKEDQLIKEMYYINTQGGLNVRDKPGADGKKIATLLMNDLVYFLEKTEISLTLNDYNKSTGKTKEISGNWVKIKSQSPPKLKGDKILWEDNTENIEGYVFDGFLNKLETSVNDHLQGKFYNKEQLSYLKLLKGSWIVRFNSSEATYCGNDSGQYLYNKFIEPDFDSEIRSWTYTDSAGNTITGENRKLGKWYIRNPEGGTFEVDSIELTEEKTNGIKVFKIKGKLFVFEEGEDDILNNYIEEYEELFYIDTINNELVDYYTNGDLKNIFDQCRRNKTSDKMEVLKGDNWVQVDELIATEFIYDIDTWQKSVQGHFWKELRNNPLNPYGYKFFEFTQLTDEYGNDSGGFKSLKYTFKVSQSYYDAIQKFPNMDAWWGGNATPLGNKMVNQIVEHQNNCDRTPGYIGGYGACPDIKLLKL
jgi:hypothetical protein